MRVSYEEYQRRLKLPLSEKIIWAKQVITEFWAEYHEKSGGKGVYVAFSGGKDSQVLLHLVRSMFPNTVAVFADTKLEFPEIRKRVKTFDNVIWTKPTKMFKDVVKEDGFAIGSKKISRMISDLQNPTSKNEASRNLYLTGIKRDGTKSNVFKLPKKWEKLQNAPFKVSGKCCDYFKKEPFKIYEKETEKKVILGTTASESEFRRVSYMKTGCNSFGRNAMCRPLSIWTEQDIWDYAELNGLKFCDVYYDRYLEDGTFIQGEKRTGCVVCCFGITEEKGENRIQRLGKTHPKMHKYFIEEAGLGKVLRYVNVKYLPEQEQKQLKLF